VNPFALKTLDAYSYPAQGYRSKSWDEFAGHNAPVMDFVFTVCDQAAGEACPYWPGQPITAHWGIEDPAAVEGSDIDKERASTRRLAARAVILRDAERVPRGCGAEAQLPRRDRRAAKRVPGARGVVVRNAPVERDASPGGDFVAEHEGG
jgi:hypothetical protein